MVTGTISIKRAFRAVPTARITVLEAIASGFDRPAAPLAPDPYAGDVAARAGA